MSVLQKTRMRLVFAGAISGLVPVVASCAQSASAEGTEADTVVVTGSRIASGAEAALPVTIYGTEELDSLGVVSGDELMRSLPQLGDVSWHATWLAGGSSSNAARGDVGSINLKHLGASNTLVLINGRRSVVHSTMSTVDGGVANFTYNSNAIPMFSVESLEILRDGAAAVYGSDAVAGVVNFTTLRNLDGEGALKVQYGATASNPSDLELSGYWGSNFADGRGNVTIGFGANRRSAIGVEDNWYTRTNDRRSFFAGTPLEGAGSLDMRSTATPWPYLRAVTGVSPAGTLQGLQVRVGGVPITDASGYFHIEPLSQAGTHLDLGSGLGIQAGNLAINGADRNLRQEVQPGVELTPSTDRAAFFSNWRYDINDAIEAYGELAGYRAWSRMSVGSGVTSTLQPTIIPADAYWNPLGPITSPNRIPGLTNVPDEGLAVELRSYQFADGGLGPVKVINGQSRFLFGLRGRWKDFDWDTALLYSRSQSTDRQRGYSVSGFLEAVSRTTPDAYNPFNGGSLADPSGGDATPSDAAAFQYWVERINKTELALWDFKLSTPDLLALPAGGLGAAAGIEFRYESYTDNRDPTVTGENPFTERFTGAVYPSTLFGASPSPDLIDASRDVSSAFIEFAVPLVASEWHIPLLRSLDLQIAARGERYSDAGSVAKPKFAVAWNIVNGLTARGSWSQGFKAPNLEVVNSKELVRFNARTDWVRCEADLRAGRITSYAGCSRIYPTQSRRQGNPDLKPEESTSTSVGLVFEPTFLPERAGRLVLSADWWKIEVDGVIGILGEGNGLIVDAYERIVNGERYAAVERAEPTPTEIAEFAGTGLEPVGEVRFVDDRYQNLAPVTVEGLDLSVSWRLRAARAGSFLFTVNASQLREYSQAMLPPLAAAYGAQKQGLLDDYIQIPGGGDNQIGRALIGGSGVSYPEWKVTGTLTWSLGPWTVRGSAQYIDSLISGVWPDDSDFVVPATTRYNASVHYAFEPAGMSVEMGGRNLTNRDPPLTHTGAYLGAVYQPYGRYLYASLTKNF